MKKILVYGGSFSPPHIGHAITIESAIRQFKCDEIWLLVSPDRPDKKMSASVLDRQTMLEILTSEIFTKPSIPLKISDFELKQGKFKSTYDTYKKLKNDYKDYEFAFLFGTDVIADLMDWWTDGAALASEAEIVAYPVNRGKQLPEILPKFFTLLDQEIVTTTISSTFIRNLIARGYSGLPYLTPGVAEYIQQHEIYKNGDDSRTLV